MALLASKLGSWFRGPLLCRGGPLHTLARALSGLLGGWSTFHSVTEPSRPRALSRAQWTSSKTCHCKPNKPMLFFLLVSKDS